MHELALVCVCVFVLGHIGYDITHIHTLKGPFISHIWRCLSLTCGSVPHTDIQLLYARHNEKWLYAVNEHYIYQLHNNIIEVQYTVKT